LSDEIKKKLLVEAEAIVTGPRADAYGDAAINHIRIANLWSDWLHNRNWATSTITPYDVAMMMLLVKVARCQQKPSHDNHVDVAGYAAVLEDIYHHTAGEQEDGGQEAPTPKTE
jgi:hypothetical protein